MADARAFIPRRLVVSCATAAPRNLFTMDQTPAIGNSRLQMLLIPGTPGLMTASAIWPSACATTCSITTIIFGAPKTSILMEVGPMETNTAGSGGRTAPLLVTMTIGRRIVTEAGSGFHLMDGPGWVMSPGAGRLITMVAGSITTTTGPGVRAANITGIAVGGVRLWSLLYQ